MNRCAIALLIAAAPSSIALPMFSADGTSACPRGDAHRAARRYQHQYTVKDKKPLHVQWGRRSSWRTVFFGDPARMPSKCQRLKMEFMGVSAGRRCHRWLNHRRGRRLLTFVGGYISSINSSRERLLDDAERQDQVPAGAGAGSEIGGCRPHSNHLEDVLMNDAPSHC